MKIKERLDFYNSELNRIFGGLTSLDRHRVEEAKCMIDKTQKTMGYMYSVLTFKSVGVYKIHGKGFNPEEALRDAGLEKLIRGS